MVALTVLDAEKFLLDKREGPAIQVAVEEDRSARPLKADRIDLESDMIKLIVLTSSLMSLLGSWVFSSRRSISEISAKHSLRSRHGRTRLREREPRMGDCASTWREYPLRLFIISIASPRLPEARHKEAFECCLLWVALMVLPRPEIDADGSLRCQKSNRRCCCSRIVCLLCQRPRCHFRKLMHVSCNSQSHSYIQTTDRLLSPYMKTAHLVLSSIRRNVCS